MKTKIILSIMMLAWICNIYANVDSSAGYQLAIKNPGKPIIVSSELRYEYSKLSITCKIYQESKIVIYDQGKFSNPFIQSVEIYDGISWATSTGLLLGCWIVYLFLYLVFKE